MSLAREPCSDMLYTKQTKERMLSRSELCDVQAVKIRQARMALTMGMHDPTLMAEIAQLNKIIHTVVEFEKKLFNDNMDID